MIFLRPVRGFDIFGALRRLEFRLLKFEKISVKPLFFTAFVYLGGKSMAPWIANVYPSNSQRKVKSGFDLCRNVFLDGMPASVLLATILIDLGTDRWL